MTVSVVTLADRPDLFDSMWSMPDSWPEFMLQDPVSSFFYRPDVVARVADHVVIALDGDEVVGKGYALPLRLDPDALPADGWDAAIRLGVTQSFAGVAPTVLCALEIAVRPDRQGDGLSSLLLAEVRRCAARTGLSEVIVPVRPSGPVDPGVPLSEYASRVRDDGLPVDPWLRVHIRAGGHIAGIAPRSMVIAGTLDEWRRWTGLPFDRSGPIEVPGALAPVLCDVVHGTAVHVEANVWVRHRAASTG